MYDRMAEDICETESLQLKMYVHDTIGRSILTVQDVMQSNAETEKKMQALRTAVPALSNSLIGMIKDTSLASNITVAELFMAGQRVAARTYIFLPIYCEVAVVYLLFCTVITKLQAVLEHRLNARGFQ